MRILTVAPFYPDAKNISTYRFVHARTKNYVKAGNKVRVFVPSKRFSLTYNYEHINVMRAPLDFIVDLTNKFDPDVITVHGPNGRWFTRLSKLNRPMILWIHGAEALPIAFHNYFCPFILKDNVKKILLLSYDPIKRTLLRRLIQSSMAVVYVSKWMKNTVERYTLIKHPLSFIVPNPIDVGLFKPVRKKNVSRINKGISVRALMWKYGLDIAIRAYSKMKGAHLTVVGKGPLEGYFRKVANICESSVTMMTAEIEHEKLPTVYNQFGYFVAPSRTEAQGVAMCEAMACGLPVIASRTGGIPEFVVDGFNGLLVEPENPLKLRKAIKKLVLNRELHNYLSRNAVRSVRDNLSHALIYRKECKVIKRAQEVFQNRSHRINRENRVVDSRGQPRAHQNFPFEEL